MMNDMGHRRRLTVLAAAGSVGASVVAAVASGCSPDPPAEPDASRAQSVALRVETVSGAGRLDDETRAEAEGEVGSILSTYVVEAFLGDFPREEFVRSFESFTSGAARDGAADIDVLTAARARDATGVRATELDARLSFLARGGEVQGGTATVHFAFEATMSDGSTRPLVLDGRFLLDGERGTWSIFGYDVTLDDGAPLDAEVQDGQAAAEVAP